MNVRLRRILVGSAIGIFVTTGVGAREERGMTSAAFVRMAALSDMFETKSSELAAVKGNDADRAFAAQMNAAHQKTSSELSVIVKGHSTDLPLPSRLDPAHQRMFDHLEGLEGVEFTRQYREDQRVAHQQALRLLDAFAASGRDEQLKQWAAQTAPKVRLHLEMLQALAR